jgi:hypothetical protein
VGPPGDEGGDVPLKPLSMLTTTTLAEQALSMVSSGATPEKAAP